jgi:membrane glycosyltransferase
MNDNALRTPQRLGLADLRKYTHAAAPKLQRGRMVPVPWRGLGQGLAAGLAGLLRRGPAATQATAKAAGQPTRLAGWHRAARWRRSALLLLVLLSATLAAGLLLLTQPLGDGGWVRIAQVALFTLLFAWVAAGFFTAVMGWFVLRRGDVQGLSHARVAGNPIAADARTAVVMPICNEHVSTVRAGLQATAESLVAAGGARLCEIYILSDSSDAATRRAELAAWEQLRDEFGPTGLRVHYRWRLRRTHKKAGNVADFCRRWGRRHRYMVVLDADSVMSGESILGLVRLMEAQPKAGIIQSAPVACGLDTVHARAQQFATRVTGRLFSAGMQYWQLGESHYWGHNAIIRIEPFMQHCALAAIPGRGGLAGPILSHDFVEAALMRRGGWEVWLVPDLPGSYEQQPPHLLAELQRDRRWCQGNLQNAQLIAEPGLAGVHRAMLGTGAMSYVSAPLWLAFVAVGVTLWLGEGHPWQAINPLAATAVAGLWVATLGMLLLPRALGVALVLRQGQHHLHGGATALLGSAVLEAGLSMLQAPLRMAGHTLFVLGALTGLKLEWKSPPRQAEALPWGDAARALGGLAAVAALALAAAAWANAGMALWLAPMLLPLVLAVPIVVACGRPALGRALRRAGLLVTPEEAAPAPVLQRAWALAAAAEVDRVPVLAACGRPLLAPAAQVFALRPAVAGVNPAAPFDRRQRPRVAR